MRLLSQKERIRGFYPTEVRLPLWTRPMLLKQALASVRISEVNVRQISMEFRPEARLIHSLATPELPVALNPLDIEAELRSMKPLVTGEVVEWMQICGVENVVMEQRIREYNRLGSEVIGRSNDPWLPGLTVEDVSYPSRQTGSGIRSAGFAVATTPRGNFNVPAMRKSPGVFSDIISWGSISYLGSAQWGGNLLKWKSLAETPIAQSVGFYMDRAGNQAPNFFVQKPATPRLSVRVRQVFSSDGDQTLGISFRDPTNYGSEVGTKSVAIAGGQNEVTYTVSAFPYVPPLVAMIQPEDKKSTTLDAYEVA